MRVCVCVCVKGRGGGGGERQTKSVSNSDQKYCVQLSECFIDPWKYYMDLSNEPVIVCGKTMRLYISYCFFCVDSNGRHGE